MQLLVILILPYLPSHHCITAGGISFTLNVFLEFSQFSPLLNFPETLTVTCFCISQVISYICPFQIFFDACSSYTKPVISLSATPGSMKQILGFVNHDKLHSLRQQILQHLLGCEITEYVLLNLNRNHLHLYHFAVKEIVPFIVMIPNITSWHINNNLTILNILIRLHPHYLTVTLY